MWETLQFLVVGQDIRAEIRAMHHDMTGFSFHLGGSQSPPQWGSRTDGSGRRRHNYWLRPHSPLGRGRRARNLPARCIRNFVSPASPAQPAQPRQPILWDYLWALWHASSLQPAPQMTGVVWSASLHAWFTVPRIQPYLP